MMFDSGIDRRLVRETIPDEAIDDAGDLRQPLWNLRRVLLMVFRHRGGDNSTLGIYPDRPFLPALGFLLTGFLALPCALAADL